MENGRRERAVVVKNRLQIEERVLVILQFKD